MPRIVNPVFKRIVGSLPYIITVTLVINPLLPQVLHFWIILVAIGLFAMFIFGAPFFGGKARLVGSLLAILGIVCHQLSGIFSESMVGVMMGPGGIILSSEVALLTGYSLLSESIPGGSYSLSLTTFFLGLLLAVGAPIIFGLPTLYFLQTLPEFLGK